MLLCIEIDGWYHNETQDYDNERSLLLENNYGIKTIRFTNDEVEKNLEWVAIILKEIINERTKRLW